MYICFSPEILLKQPCALLLAEGENCHISVVNSSVPLVAVSKTFLAPLSTYVGDVLSIEGEKGSASDYNHIVATAGGTSVSATIVLFLWRMSLHFFVCAHVRVVAVLSSAVFTSRGRSAVLQIHERDGRCDASWWQAWRSRDRKRSAHHARWFEGALACTLVCCLYLLRLN
jgi:hypothetical protein